MRRPYLALSAAVVAAVALSVPVLRAQQFSGGRGTQASTSTAGSGGPMSPARGARHLLRNGLDYIELGAHERALELFREAESRQFELTEAERKDLQVAIERARQALRGAETGVPGEGPPTIARRASARSRPGAIAVSTPSPAVPDPRSLALPDEPLQLVGGGTVETPAVHPQPDSGTNAPGEPTFELPELPGEAPTTTTALEEPAALPPLPGGIPTSVPAAVADLPSPIAPPPLSDRDVAGMGPAASRIAAEPVAETPIAVPNPTPIEVPAPEMVEIEPVPAPEVELALPELPAASPALSEEMRVEAPAAVDEAVPLATPAEGPVGEPLLPPVEPVPVDESYGLPELPEAPSLSAPPIPAPVDPGLLPAQQPAPRLPEAPVQSPAAMLPTDLSLEPVGLPEATVETRIAPPDQPPAPADASLESVQASATDPTPPPPPPAAEEVLGLERGELPMLPGAALNDAGRDPGPISPPVPPEALEMAISEPHMPGSVPSRDGMPIPSGEDDGIDLPPLPGSSGLPMDGGQASAADVVGRISTDGLALPDRVLREVEEIARRQRDEVRRPGDAIGAAPDEAAGAGMDDYRLGTSGIPSAAMAGYGDRDARIELPRPPSPTQARPIRAIPVPEEFVPLLPREWSPSRKVWAAPATCHGPLYFQDAVLERYGQNIEQALGPHWGRYTSYPLDDPKQSNQRNQILQPFVSIGLFAGQVALLPYNLLMDPPWEAEYDLGYYRPADPIPPDTYYFPTHGIGPPLHGSDY